MVLYNYITHTHPHRDLGGAGETIAAFADGDVEDELLDFDLSHGIRQLLLRCLPFIILHSHNKVSSLFNMLNIYIHKTENGERERERDHCESGAAGSDVGMEVKKENKAATEEGFMRLAQGHKL